MIMLNSNIRCIEMMFKSEKEVYLEGWIVTLDVLKSSIILCTLVRWHVE